MKIFKKYCGLLPVRKSCSKLYLQPKIKFTPKVWYFDQPYGNNKVGKTVRELCHKDGFEGKFTNHSLRATSASRMYQNNKPEQVIKEVTYHKSDCVKMYKRTSDNIREEASKTHAGSKSNNCQKVGDEPKVNEIENERVRGDKEFENLMERNKQNLSVSQMIKNVIKTRMELRKKRKKSMKVVNIAKKLLKRHKVGNKKLTKGVCRGVGSKRYVIDVIFTH